MPVLVRPARPDDGADLARIDLATWTPATSPAPPPTESAAYAFFDERTTPGDVLVAEVGGAVAGYVKLRPVTALPSHAHVLQIGGLAVDPARQGQGAGQALVESAVHAARARGARKLTLRVLGSNATARRLYERCGFVVEGVLEREFLLDGAYVDDVFMAVHLVLPPDMKDWTWVLSAPCPECGFDAQGIAPDGVAAALRRAGPVFGSVLADGDAARRRPAPQVWSALEYACHVRDAARVFLGRLRLMLATSPPDEPRFADWDQDAAAVDGRYGEQDPARVAAELTDACEQLARAFEAVPAEALDRGGVRSDGVRFTVASLGRYLVHELVHHAHDVTGGRAPAVSP